MDADRRNDTGIFRYTDVEYTPEGHTDAYRWDDFLGIAGGHVYSAMDTIDMVSTGGQYEGDEPEHAYACEIVGCCGLRDGVALFRPVSHDGADLIQIAFLRNDVDDATGAYTERFEARTFFQNLTLMDSEEIAKLDGRPIIPSAGADECRAAVLAFNERMVPRRRELGLGDTAVVGKTKKSETTSKVVPMKKEQAVHGLGRVDFSGLGYGWGTGYPDSLSVDAIGIDFPSGEHNIILNFSPITHAPDVDGRKLFCHETTIGYDLNADSWSGATIGPDFWTLDGKEAREFAENIGLDRLAARACVRLGIEAPGLKGREALPIPKATDVVPEPSVQAEAAKNAVTEVTVIPAWVSFPDEPGTAQYRLFCEQDTEPLDIDEQIFFSGYTAEELCGMVGKTVNGDFTIVGVEEPEKMKATYVRPVQKAYNPADMAAAAKKTAAAKLSGDGSGGGKRI